MALLRISEADLRGTVARPSGRSYIASVSTQPLTEFPRQLEAPDLPWPDSRSEFSRLKWRP